MHPPIAGFVDNAAAGSDGRRQEFGGSFIGGTGDDQVDPFEAVVSQFFDSDAAAGKIHLLSGAASGGQQAEVASGKAALFQQLQDDSSDGTGSTHHSNSIKHGKFPW